MKIGTWIRVGGLAILIGAAAPAMGASKTAVETFAAQIAKGDAILMDVREADEIKDGMASPAIWLAGSEFNKKNFRYKDIIKSLPKDKQILVYCGTDTCAGRFVEELAKSGFKAENFGSYSDWRDAGKSVKPVADAQAKPCPFLCKPAG